MQRILLYVGRFFAILLMPAEVALITATIFVAATIPSISQPETIKAGLEAQRIYPDVVLVALPALVELTAELQDPPSRIDLDEIRDTLAPDDWRSVAHDLMPPEWVQAQTESALDSIYGYIGGGEAVDYALDIEELAAGFYGAGAERAVTRILTFSPNCSPAQLRQIRQIPINNDENIPICNPNNPLQTERMTAAMLESFAIIGASLTRDDILADTLDIGFFQIEERLNPSDDTLTLPMQAEAEGSSRDAFIFLRIVHELRGMYTRPAISAPVALFGLIVFFAVRSFRGLAVWSGWVSILSGSTLVVTLLLFSMGIIGQSAASQVGTDLPSEIEMIQIRIFDGIVSSVYRDFSPRVLASAIMLFIAGVSLLVFSRVLPGPKRLVRLNPEALPSTSVQPQ